VQTEPASAELPLLVEGLVALGIGLFIGLEREHRHVEEGEPDKTINGVRTFALLALSGWLAALLQERWAWAAPVLLAMVGLMLVAQYVRESSLPGRLGVTTELAALLTVAYGLLVHVQVRLAVALALVTTLVLVSKPWINVVMPKLLRTELLAALQFLIVVAVVLPLLPDQPRDPWGVLPPRRIAMFVVLVAGVGFVGYVLTRLFGRAKAAGVTGIVGGLVSSTAVTANMAHEAARSKGASEPGQLAVLAANAIMPLRVVVILFAVSRETSRALAVPMLAMSLVLAVFAWRLRGAVRPSSGAEDRQLPVTNPFALLPALKWGAFLCTVLLVAHFARKWLGDSGLLVTAAVSGLADVDAISLVAARDVAGGTLSTHTAALAITIAVMTNSAVKAGIALVSGGKAFGRPVALALGLGMAAALLAALVT
jgi:uncharacterized membrane protein (DUF4010 family)